MEWVTHSYAECIKIWVTSGFNVNYRYRIVSMTLPTLTANEVCPKGKAVTLENVKSKEKFTTDVYTLDKHFRYDYCTTCHSAQGASIRRSDS